MMENSYEFKEMEIIESAEQTMTRVSETEEQTDEEIAIDIRKRTSILLGILFTISIIISGIIVVLVGKQADKHVFVNIEGLGRLKGIERPGVDTYFGIPFVTPPRRWEKAPPLTEWDDLQDATKGKPNCVDGNGYGSEDCLYLNIFTPHGARHMRPLPVLIWFHGGCFSFGGPSDYEVGTDLVNDHNIIVVVPAFRLGMFGNLYSKAENLTENYGLEDQHSAMQFVNKYISSFGGDPEKVTLFGQSSGAAGVSFHYIRESSRKLFRAAIAISSAFAPWGSIDLKNADEQYGKILKLNDCETLDCLKGKSVSELVSKDIEVECVDGCAFSPASQENLLNLVNNSISDNNDIPLLVGSCSDDGASYTPLSRLPHSVNATEIDLSDYIKERFPNASNTFLSSLSRVLSFNPNHTRTNCSEFCAAANDIETQFAYACPATTAVDNLVERDVTVWNMKFTENPRPNEIPFVPHSCMQPYFWNFPVEEPTSWKRRQHTKQQSLVGKSLRKAFANFIKDPFSPPEEGWISSKSDTLSSTFIFPEMKMEAEPSRFCEFFKKHADYFTTCEPEQ